MSTNDREALQLTTSKVTGVAPEAIEDETQASRPPLPNRQRLREICWGISIDFNSQPGAAKSTGINVRAPFCRKQYRKARSAVRFDAVSLTKNKTGGGTELWGRVRWEETARDDSMRLEPKRSLPPGKRIRGYPCVRHRQLDLGSSEWEIRKGQTNE